MFKFSDEYDHQEALIRKMLYNDIQKIKKLIVECANGADKNLTLEAIGRITSEYETRSPL